MKWIRYAFAAVLGFATVVEMAHMRHYVRVKNHFRVATTAVAAFSCGYMASEALTQDWPEWDGE